MNTTSIARRTAAALATLGTLLATTAAVAHPGHPAVGGPLDHVHADADGTQTAALVAAGLVSALVLAAGRRWFGEPPRGWRGVAVGAVQGLAMAGVALGVAGAALWLGAR